MSIVVDMWTWHENQFWQAEVRGHPEINATGGTQQEAKDYLVQAWNRTNDDNATLDAFSFTIR